MSFDAEATSYTCSMMVPYNCRPMPHNVTVIRPDSN